MNIIYSDEDNIPKPWVFLPSNSGLTNRRPFPPWEAGYENDNTIDSSKFWLDSNVKTNLKGYFNGESQQVPRQKKDPLLYAEMLEIHNKYTTPTRLHEVHHTWSTQKKTRPWIRALPSVLRRDATTLPLARSIAASWLPSGSTVVGCTIFQRFWKRLVVVYRLRGSYGSSTRGTTRTQARHHVWGVVELTTNVATARSVGSSKEGASIWWVLVFFSCLSCSVLSFEFFVSCVFYVFFYIISMPVAYIHLCIQKLAS
jgi:hypothetical protein